MLHGKVKNRFLIYMLFGMGSVLGLSGIDLLLPSIPLLPDILGGDPTLSQLVIASFVAGTAFGMILFGNIASKIDISFLLFCSLISYAVLFFILSLQT
ncbi:hypothetical protein AB3N59_19340 [Leptospira sp. WS92.C1]